MSLIIAMQGRASILFLALFSAAAFGAEVRPDPPPYVFPTTVFEQAEFVLNAQRLPPGDDASWEAVALPDNWRRTRPGVDGAGWYRIKFHLEGVPVNVHGVFVPHRGVIRFGLFINGDVFAASSSSGTFSIELRSPIFLTIPPALLKPGENVLHARVEASSARNKACLE